MTTRGWLAAGLWVSATAAATVVSFAIVAGVSGRVVTADVSASPKATATDRITTDAGDVRTSPTTASAPPPATSTSVPPPRSASPASPGVTTTVPASPPTTQAPAPSASPSPAPTPATVRQTYTVQGGILTVACTGSSIALDSATPSDGYRLRVDRSGPDRVEVRFESDGGGSRVEATCVDGRPSAQVDPDSSGPGGGGSDDSGGS